MKNSLMLQLVGWSGEVREQLLVHMRSVNLYNGIAIMITFLKGIFCLIFYIKRMLRLQKQSI